MAASSVAAVPVKSSQALQQKASREEAPQHNRVYRISKHVWIYALTFSPIPDIAAFAKTCKLGQEIFNSEFLFKTLVARDFPVVHLNPISEVSTSNKDTYKKELKDRLTRIAEAKALNSLMQRIYERLATGHLSDALDLLGTEGPTFKVLQVQNREMIANFIAQGPDDALRSARRLAKLIDRYTDLFFPEFPMSRLHKLCNWNPQQLKEWWQHRLQH